MNRAVPLILLCLILHCGGAGDKSSNGQAPAISNLKQSVTSALQNAGTAGIEVMASFDFEDPEGDIAFLRINTNSQDQDFQLTGLPSTTSGSLYGNIKISTANRGDTFFQITLFDSNQHASNTLTGTLHVLPPPPNILYLSPMFTKMGSQSFTLNVSGYPYTRDSIVRWNGFPRPTTFVSTELLQADITAQDIAMGGMIPVTVSNPDSEGGTSFTKNFPVSDIQTTVMQIRPNDIVWDPIHSVIYASLPSSASSNPNSIAVINPNTGSIKFAVSAGSEPNRLALSEDCQYLYVGLDGASSIQRFTLPSLTKDISIPLGTATLPGPYNAADIQVAPANAHTIAVSLGGLNGIVIFDDATPRSHRVSGNFYNFLQWGSDTSTLFSASSGNSMLSFFVLAVDSTGVSLVKEQSGALIPNACSSIHFDRSTGLVYADTGQVLEPSTIHPAGIFQSSGVIAVDAPQNKIFVLSGSPFDQTFTLSSFDQTLFTPISSTGIIPFGTSATISPVTRLLRWGSDGLAFSWRGSPVYLVSGPFVSEAIQSTAAPAFALSSISPMSSAAGGPSFTLAINGSGFAPGCSIEWNGNPRPTTYISNTSTFTISDIKTLLVNIPANDITWDAVHHVIYASLPSTAGKNGNSIVAIDPLSGEIRSSVYAGSEPNRLALSDDGMFLYVGLDGASSVQRFNLPSLSQDITIPLGSDSLLGPFFALDIQVAPAAPGTIAVQLGNTFELRNTSASTIGYSVVIFDDEKPRPCRSGIANSVDSIQWGADANVVYGANSSLHCCNLFSVGAQGISESRSLSNDFHSSACGIHYEKSSNRLYSDSGDILSLQTENLVGYFPISGPMIPDAPKTLAFYLDSRNTWNQYFTLQSYDLAHLTPVGSATIVPVRWCFNLPNPNRILRWGTDGLAFTGRGNPLYVVSGSFVPGQ